VAVVAGVAVGAGLVCILAAAAVAWHLGKRRSKMQAVGSSSGGEGFMGVEGGITPAAALAALAAGASTRPGGVYHAGAATAPPSGAVDVTPSGAAGVLDK
jgi:hypothetical protein